MKPYSKLLLTLLCALSLGLAASAQTLLVGADVTKKLPHKMSVGIEGEFRTMQWVKHTERWTIAGNFDYKPWKFLKVGAQYKYMQVQELGGGTPGLDSYNAYFDQKHRVSISATGSFKIWKFEFSLRERYQYTFRPYHEVPRFDAYGPLEEDDNKIISAKSKHVLRSRLQIEFKPYKKCPWKPYANVELYSLLSDVNHTKGKVDGAKFYDKYRVTAGTEYKINKKNSLDIFYRYANTADPEDHEMGHTIGLIYSFDF